MFGEGIKRNLLPENLQLLQIEQNPNLIAALFKKKESYIKVIWEIVKPIDKDRIQKSLDPNTMFVEEKKGNVVFKSADYIIHYHDKHKIIYDEEYKEKEYDINTELNISDDFLSQLTTKGKNILSFEKFINEKQN